MFGKNTGKSHEFCIQKLYEPCSRKSGSRKVARKPRGVGEERGNCSTSLIRFSLRAIFCPLAFSLLSHFLRSSALTESLTQASLFLNHRGKIASTDHVQTRCGRLLLERSL